MPAQLTEALRSNSRAVQVSGADGADGSLAEFLAPGVMAATLRLAALLHADLPGELAELADWMVARHGEKGEQEALAWMNKTRTMCHNCSLWHFYRGAS